MYYILNTLQVSVSSILIYVGKIMYYIHFTNYVLQNYV